LVTVAAEGSSILGDHFAACGGCQDWRNFLPSALEAFPPAWRRFPADGKYLIAGLWDGQIVVPRFRDPKKW